MTVRELIEVLSKIEDQEVRVMVKGYERGVDDIEDIPPAIVNVALDVNEKWYYGRHEVEYYDDNFKDKEVIKAIVLR